MQRVILVVLLLSCMAVLSVRADNSEMLAPPPRPEEFTSAQQLRQYLAALNEYYSIMGRPRFGKRGDSFRKREFFRTNGERYPEDAAAWTEFQ
ncbi:pro-neuropeptide Y precursor [Aplysia californica]|uniref:Pro-neuropeptide Y n=1 Tax=Aplysia californica TaxID=6500 RepID=NPY_APLCA|nr:pro-neuropeptide Y precursor [Aplysia californica]Q27441.1 RecName: Full=Pro-neuropeptide Y; Contains: RecName: Full=Neuropeptide Y; AltName: Full=Neuropeptide tyrosine; Short=NPY; Contains: RecName: Full=C-flanking peptide of NPY; Short=CPON; Flags: Precursor [Aplysia californica]AAA27772.1 neuropeptide Y [Aplysia californica]